MVEPAEVWAASAQGALRQCELISGLIQATLDPESLGTDGPIPIVRTWNSWVVTLSQDCDLDWDYNARQMVEDIAGHNKELPNVLVCQALTVDDFRSRPQVNADLFKRIRQNQDERFHTLLEAPEALDSLGEGIPQLVVDFKRYFTVPTAELYRRFELPDDAADAARRRAYLLAPFRDDVSTRSSRFMARIALPE